MQTRQFIASIQSWNFMRWIRVFMALYLFFFAYTQGEVFAWALGGLFLMQAVTNIGCCSTSGCSVNRAQKQETFSDDIDYEEVK